MRRLKIAYVIGSLSPGGSERQMLALAERLPSERFSVDFVLLSGPGPYAAQAERAGARVRVLSPRGDGASFKPLTASVVALRFTGLLRRCRYDIVDAWLFRSYALAALTRPLTGVPVLIAGRRSLNDHKEGFGLLERRLDAIARKRSDVIVANAEAVAADVTAREGINPQKLRVIRNGVEPRRGSSGVDRLTQRRHWGVDDHQTIIGCIANYHPGKGHLHLLGAFAELVREHPDVRLVLVGEGDLRPTLERRIGELGIRESVILHGEALEPRSLIGGFDVVVQASESEGLPNALLEAAAEGRPIVATAAGGTVEIVEHGRTGLLVPIADTGALVRALTAMVDDPDLRRRLASNAREHVLHTFGMDRFVAEFAALYEEMAAEKGLLQ